MSKVGPAMNRRAFVQGLLGSAALAPLIAKGAVAIVPAVAEPAWHEVVVTRHNATARYFLDGIEVAEREFLLGNHWRPDFPEDDFTIRWLEPWPSPRGEPE